MFYYLMNLPQIKPRVDEGNIQGELNGKKTMRPRPQLICKKCQRQTAAAHQSCGKRNRQELENPVQDSWEGNKEECPDCQLVSN